MHSRPVQLVCGQSDKYILPWFQVSSKRMCPWDLHQKPKDRLRVHALVQTFPCQTVASRRPKYLLFKKTWHTLQAGHPACILDTPPLASRLSYLPLPNMPHSTAGESPVEQVPARTTVAVPLVLVRPVLLFPAIRAPAIQGSNSRTDQAPTAVLLCQARVRLVDTEQDLVTLL